MGDEPGHRVGRRPGGVALLEEPARVDRLPDLPALPPPMRGAFLLHVRFSFLGGSEAGAALIAPIRAAGTAVVGMVLLGDPVGTLRILSIVLIVAGVIGLNLAPSSAH